MRNCKIKFFYGTMWQYGDNTEVEIGGTDTYEPIPGMSNGDDIGFIFQNTQQLKCTKPGKYKVDWNICFNNGNNTTWTAGILINDTIAENTIGCRKLGAVDTGAFGGTGLINLAEDDVVELSMANQTDTSNAFIDSANLTLIRVDK